MKKGTLASSTKKVAGCVGMLLAMSLPILAADGDAKKGEAIFGDTCAACHNATSTDVLVGPGLKGLFKRDKLVNGKPMSEDNVRALINDGSGNMPPMGDSLKAKPDDFDNLLAYLKTL